MSPELRKWASILKKPDTFATVCHRVDSRKAYLLSTTMSGILRPSLSNESMRSLFSEPSDVTSSQDTPYSPEMSNEVLDARTQGSVANDELVASAIDETGIVSSRTGEPALLEGALGRIPGGNGLDLVIAASLHRVLPGALELRLETLNRTSALTDNRSYIAGDDTQLEDGRDPTAAPHDLPRWTTSSSSRTSNRADNSNQTAGEPESSKISPLHFVSPSSNHPLPAPMTRTIPKTNQTKRPARLEEPEPTLPRKRVRFPIDNDHSEVVDSEDDLVDLDSPPPDLQRPPTPQPSTALGGLPQKATPASPPAPFTVPSPGVHLRILRGDIIQLKDTPLTQESLYQHKHNWPGMKHLGDMPPGWPYGGDGKLSLAALWAPDGVHNPAEEEGWEHVVNDEMEMDWIPHPLDDPTPPPSGHAGARTPTPPPMAAQQNTAPPEDRDSIFLRLCPDAIQASESDGGAGKLRHYFEWVKDGYPGFLNIRDMPPEWLRICPDGSLPPEAFWHFPKWEELRAEKEARRVRRQEKSKATG
ncbi:hypothetical protein FPV67DRAFT_1530091 [Lyophyllum atratum]|nr:hypothetical protein FPV67DRAFT_1530091 [Lyophyllum atratum]